jgi:hypothetical protein
MQVQDGFASAFTLSVISVPQSLTYCRSRPVWVSGTCFENSHSVVVLLTSSDQLGWADCWTDMFNSMKANP